MSTSQFTVRSFFMMSCSFTYQMLAQLDLLRDWNWHPAPEAYTFVVESVFAASSLTHRPQEML